MDSPVARRVSTIQQERRGARVMHARINEEGWRLIDTSTEQLKYVMATTSPGGYAVLARRDFSSPAEIFASIFPANFIQDVLDDILNRSPDAFDVNIGRERYVKMKVLVEDVYQCLACRVWMQGNRGHSGMTLKEALKNAIANLGRDLPVPLSGYRKINHIHGKFYISGGCEFEKRLCTAFQSLLKSLGEVLCGDERLFRFTGMGAIVRKVITKPARISIWHYQGVVTLPNGEPYLVYTRTHNTASSMGESTSTASIVADWADLVKRFLQPTAICMDSYYLSAAGRHQLHTSGIRYVAALNPDRFRNIVQLLEPPVQNTGDSSWAWNEARQEAAVYHSSRDTNIGKKFTLTNCFERSSNPQPEDRLPIYDEYKAMFSGCDKFNQSLHNRTLPFRLPNDTNKARDKNIWNYLFTSAVINTWNIWKNVLETRSCESHLPDFQTFCCELAKDIVNKYVISQE